MSFLTEQSGKYKKLADELLTSSKLLSVLEKYGKVNFVGSYKANLMMHGDIDIHILREKPFSKEETLQIFNEIFKTIKFNSYYIGDWNGENFHPEFPEGYYIGFKTRFADEKWKIDVWLVGEAEQKRFGKTYLDINKESLSDIQRETILKFKKYRNENGIKISGQAIYEMVLKKEIKDISEFEKELEETEII
jgi:hypothetical protein